MLNTVVDLEINVGVGWLAFCYGLLPEILNSTPSGLVMRPG